MSGNQEARWGPTCHEPESNATIVGCEWHKPFHFLGLRHWEFGLLTQGSVTYLWLQNFICKWQPFLLNEKFIVQLKIM